MLLGQAESGKSTLQKQFQLYYASSQLDKERPAWRPVVHFNIIKAVRMILEELDYEFTQTPTNANTTTTATTTTTRSQPVPPLPPLPPMSATARGKLPAIPGSGAAYTAARAAAANGGAGYASNTNTNGSGYESSSNSSHNNHNGGGGWQDDLAQLRTKLLPLVAVEDALARDLSGGVSVTGVSGRSGVFVRSGWQALVAPVSVRGWFGNGGGNNNSNLNSNGNGNGNQNGNGNAGASGGGPHVNDLVARMLAATKEEVAALWRHPNVRSIIRSRKLRLDESASL